MNGLQLTDQTLFKVLHEDGTYYHHEARGRWHLPQNGQPGAWKSVTGELEPCVNGLHLCRLADLPYWIGPALFTAEYDGERVDVDGPDGKVVVRKARLLRRVETWNERSLRHFAADCAEHVLPIYERQYPDEWQPRQAIIAARRFAEGLITEEEMVAARNAAGAAWDAARYAAWAAGDAAGAAAWAAAWAAPWAAARDAAGAAAGAAEHDWQAARMGVYLAGETPAPVGVIDVAEWRS